jgi:hypothetical protein
MRELSLHILDIAQNSISAGASHITIAVEASHEMDLLKVRVADDGKGMDPEFAAKVTDPFVTTRTVRRVGLGIPMLAANAELSGGGLRIDSTPGRGTTIEATFELDNIDRPPLGDIISTMITLIVANPELSFRYEHRTDGREFILSTDQIKAPLEDVPISDPTVVRWMRDYMSEGISAAGRID